MERGRPLQLQKAVLLYSFGSTGLDFTLSNLKRKIDMDVRRRDIPASLTDKWQRIVDLTARIAEVPACLIMRTVMPDHSLLVSSGSEGNPYEVGASFQLDSRLYCHSVLTRREVLIVRDAYKESRWQDNQDLDHGMSFYIGYPLIWPDGSLFGTICVLDCRDNPTALHQRDLLAEFAGLVENDLALLCETEERERLERALQKQVEILEAQVELRTRDLTNANLALREREQELENVNTALRVLLAQFETGRRQHERDILRQISGLVLPYIGKLRHSNASVEARDALLDLLETNLMQITSSFAGRLASVLEALTPTEAEIAQMVMAGKSTKEIAQVLSRETSTIDFHRNNIRRKLGVDRNRQTLRSYLLSLQ